MLLRWLSFRPIVHFFKNATSYIALFSHRDTPWYIKALVALAFLYLLSPYDLVPDWLVGLGIVDDIAVVSLLISLAVKLVNRRKEKLEKAKGDK